MPKEKFTEAYENIKSIEKMLDDAENLFCQMPETIRNVILNFHTNHYTLNHCLHWGRQAATEVRENWHVVVSELKTEETDTE